MSGSVSYPPAPVGEPDAAPRGLQVSLVLLVLANLVPVVGVLAGVITLGDVFLVYWAENVVVGAFALVRIVTARGAYQRTTAGKEPTFWVGSKANEQPMSSLPHQTGAILLGLFFCFHFGIFTLVHGVFTFSLVGMVTGFGEVSPRAVLLTLAALVVSHGYSLAVHWFKRGERDRLSPSEAMGAPYPRVMVLHVSIIGSFFLVMGRGESAFGPQDPTLSDQLVPVLLLTALKLAVDVVFHLRTHRARPAQPTGTVPVSG